MATEKSKKKPVVEVMGSGYQPSKAEMEEDISVDLSPEDLARLMLQDVEMRLTSPKRARNT